MSLRRATCALKLLRVPFLLASTIGAGCGEAVPGRAAGPAASLAIVPNELFVYVADPTRPTKVHIIGFVQDKWGRNLADHSVKFSVEEPADPGSTVFAIPNIGYSSDSVALTIAKVCPVAPQQCLPANREAVVTATHPSTGLEASIAVHVRYDKLGDYGIAAPDDTPWPMFALASMSVSGVWQHLVARPFFARVGFGKFDAGVSAPSGDAASGSALSTTHATWRKSSPWGTSPTDLVVPNDGLAAKPSDISVKAFYAADASAAAFDAAQEAFTIALQAAADVVSSTPVGATVTIVGGGVTNLEVKLPWSSACTSLASSLSSLQSGPEGDHRPTADALTIYMLADPVTGTGSPRALHCGPRQLDQATYPRTHFIVLPAGTPLPSTLAHEIGHALGLGHVSMGGGFNDDNLMAMSDEESAPMRSRLTIGQAFRAALHEQSYIVTTQQNRSGSINCDEKPLLCPALSRDALRRSPP